MKHRFVVVVDSFCMTKINSLPSANEHEKLGAKQGSTSDLFFNNQGKLLFSVQPKLQNSKYKQIQKRAIWSH